MKKTALLFGILLISILFLITSCTDLSIKRCKRPFMIGWAPPSTATCITHIAVDKVDYSICDKIEEYRYSEHTGTITDNHIKWCYAEVGARIVDISVCDKIKLRECDEDLFYLDIGLCKEQKNEENKDKCFNELGLKNFEELGIKEQSTLVCSKFDEQKTKDFCFSEIATRYEDESICDLINDKEEKDNCYESVGTFLRDISICDKIKNQRTKNFCYSDIGLKKFNVSDNSNSTLH